jgi:hypothetical protein
MMIPLDGFAAYAGLPYPTLSRYICYVLGSLAFWRVVAVIQMHMKRPVSVHNSPFLSAETRTDLMKRHIRIKFRSFAPGRCFFNLDFILEGAFLILKAYEELGKVSFAIPALTEYQILACSDLDAKAVCDSSEETLSFHAAMVDVYDFCTAFDMTLLIVIKRLKHKYTMFGFEHNDVDPHNTVPARTLKVLLRLQLPTLRPLIEARIEEGFHSELKKGTQICGGEQRPV